MGVSGQAMRFGEPAVTAQHTQPERVLPDDGIVDDIAVEIAASGARPVALTRTERLRAAALILARGGRPYVVSKRLRVSGATALALARLLAGDRATPLKVPHAAG